MKEPVVLHVWPPEGQTWQAGFQSSWTQWTHDGHSWNSQCHRNAIKMQYPLVKVCITMVEDPPCCSWENSFFLWPSWHNQRLNINVPIAPEEASLTAPPCLLSWMKIDAIHFVLPLSSRRISTKNWDLSTISSWEIYQIQNLLIMSIWRFSKKGVPPGRCMVYFMENPI